MHPLDQAIALNPLEEGTWQGRTSAAYANMIGPYGGITAAQMLAALLVHPQRLGDPLAFTVNYASAVADGAFLLRARPARTNRSTQHWLVEMEQDGQMVATATGVTAIRREVWGSHEAEMPVVPRPQDLQRTARHGVEWLNRYDMRFLEGMIPSTWDGAAQDDSLTRLWARDEPPRPLDFPALVALADIFFPRVWLRRAKLVPIGTVSMTVYFHSGAAQLAALGSGFLLVQAKGQGFGGGFFDHSGQLWSEAGALVATTHQVVYYKE